MSQRCLSFAFAGALLSGLLVSAITFVSLVNRVGRGYCPCSFAPLCPHYPDDPSSAGFARSLGKMGLPVIGTPLESCLPYGLLSDTVVHCNKAGKRYFTHQVECGLKRFLRREQMPDEPWSLRLFSADRPDSLSLALPETCRARETFAEFIVDCGSQGCTNVLKATASAGRRLWPALRPAAVRRFRRTCVV